MLQIPLVMLLMFAGVQMARVFYVYHSVQKALRGGAGLLARTTNVNYCDAGDLTIADARNFIAYGNFQGGTPLVVQGLTPDMVQVLPERQMAGTTTVAQCSCGEDANAGASCDVSSGGQPPDFIVVNLSPLYQVHIPFPFISINPINLSVSVRMPVTGD